MFINEGANTVDWQVDVVSDDHLFAGGDRYIATAANHDLLARAETGNIRVLS